MRTSLLALCLLPVGLAGCAAEGREPSPTLALTSHASLAVEDVPAVRRLGRTLAASGDTVIVGAEPCLWVPPGPVMDRQCADALFVFARGKDGALARVATLPGGDAAAASGDTLVVARDGTATVYARRLGAWFPETVLAPPLAPIEAVAVSGDVVFLAVPSADHGRGAVLVFERVGQGLWLEQGLLASPAPRPDGAFGAALSAYGDAVLVGAPGEGSGAAYVFATGPAGWVLATRLTTPALAPAARFGAAVDLDGNRAAVGAPHDYRPQGDGPGAGYGAVHVFDLAAPTRPEVLTVRPGNRAGWLGVSVDLEGDRLLAGAGPDARLDQGAGTAWLFTRRHGAFGPAEEQVPLERAPYDAFGAAVALSGEHALVGAEGAGAVFVFGAGAARGLRLDADAGPSRLAVGQSLALGGHATVVGAPYGGPPCSGRECAGAAYVYLTDIAGTYLAAKLVDPGRVATFGRLVAASGDRVAVASTRGLLVAEAGFGDFAAQSYVPLATPPEALAFDRDVVVVGQPSASRVTVMVREGDAWLPLPPMWHPTSAGFGRDVAVRDDVVVVASSSDVQLYRLARGALHHEVTFLAAQDAGGDRLALGDGVLLIGDRVIERADGAWRESPPLPLDLEAFGGQPAAIDGGLVAWLAPACGDPQCGRLLELYAREDGELLRAVDLPLAGPFATEDVAVALLGGRLALSTPGEPVRVLAITPVRPLVFE